MERADTTMRTVLIAALVTALVTTLGGCHSTRGNDTPAGTASAGKPAPKAKAAKENLPPGLGGDTAHKAYTDTPN
jgi:hypothetical protein